MYSLISAGSVLLLCFFILKSFFPDSSVTIDPFQNKKIEWIGLVIILIIAALIRFYQIDSVPLGLHVDEAAMAYDAWSLAHYGVDRWLIPYPVYLINFGGGQSAMYAYLCSFLMKLWNNSILIIRLPAILLGLITVLFTWLIAGQFFKKPAALFTALVVALCPYFIMQSRWGLDCNSFLPFFTVAIFTLLTAIRKKQLRYYILSGIGLGLCLYTYALSYIVIPLFLIFSLGFLFILKKVQFRQILAMGIPLFLLACPLMVFVLINQLKLPSIITPCFSIPALPEYRGTEISVANIRNNLAVFKTLLTTDPLPYNSFAPFYTLFLCSIPLVIHGVFCCLSRILHHDRMRPELLLILSGFLAEVICALIIFEPNINKCNGIFLFFALFIGFSVSQCLERNQHSPIIWTGLVLIYSVNSAFFCHAYFTSFTEEYYPMPYTNDCIADIVETLESHLDQPVNYYIDNNDSNIYIHLLQRFSPSPYQFQQAMRTEYQVVSFANYSFYFPQQLDDRGVYIITWYPEYEEKLQQSDFIPFEYRKYRIYIAPALLEE